MSDMLRLHHEHRALNGFGPDEFAGAFGPSEARLCGPANSPASTLKAAVTRHVIPRLHLALAEKTVAAQGATQGAAQGATHLAIVPAAALCAIGTSDIDGFVHELVAGQVGRAIHVVDALITVGHTLESIFLQLFAPAALHLHTLQADDIVGLAEAGLAFGDLGVVLRHYAHDFRSSGLGLDTGLRALLVSPAKAPAALSVFGLLLLSEFFRREGWESWVENAPAERSLRDLVLTEWFDLVEFIAPDERALDVVEAGIKAIRRGSRNRAIGVIVCGEIFREHPRFVRLVGADLAAVDPVGSLVQAKQFIAQSTTARRRLF